MVVGSGPGGLSAAYHLRRLGHAVVVREAALLAGGMMRYGIPAYRLPRDVVEAEIDRIVSMGVEIECGRTVDDLQEAMDAGGFDAAFLAVGAQRGANADIPAGDSARILDAVSFLRNVAGEAPPPWVAASSSTGAGTPPWTPPAPPAASGPRRRSWSTGAHGTGCRPTTTRSRKPPKKACACSGCLPSPATEEGSLTIEKMVLDENGFPRPTGEFEEPAGRLADPGPGPGVGPVPGADLARRRHHGGKRPGGSGHDDRPSGSVRRRGHGRRRPHAHRCHRPRQIGGARHRCLAAGHHARTPASGAAGHGGRLNTWYYADAPRSLRPQLDVARRTSTFDEVVGGLDETTAEFEARRCLSCGNCFQCDNCFGVCPDNAVQKVEDAHGYRFNYDFCKGCGICVQECPCGAIDMVPEEI